MGDTPQDGRKRSDETARLELPPLRLPRLGRRRKPDHSQTPATETPADEAPSASVDPVGTPATPTHEPPLDDEPAEVAAPTHAEPDEPLMAPPTPATPVVTTHQVDGHDNGTRPLGAVATEVEDHEPATEAPGRSFTLPALPTLPRLSTRTAVLVTGAIVGVAGALLTFLSLRGCDAVAGTESCGGGPGLLMMLAILIALTYLGGWLLRGLGIRDAGSTSFLAVAPLAVVAMLFLLDSLDEWSGAVAVTVVSVLAYALSWRATAMLAAADDDRR